MKSRYRVFLLCVLLAGSTARPQTQELSIDDAMRLGQQFLDENNLELAIPEGLEVQGAEEFLAQFQQKLNSEYVIDVAQLKKTATALLPVLEAHEETAPYAAWLKARLDYMEAAEQLQKLIPVLPVEPGKPPPLTPKPTPALERTVWKNLVEKEPMPKAASKYVPRLKPAFAKEGMPEAMVWLAEQESGFNPRARSPVGATGLFQFMPPTAKSLGLSVRWPDERLNPDKAAPAAARYLKYLHGRFHDWKLALAAYNLGEGRLRGLMERHKASTFEAVSPWLPAETQMYVPKFEALLQKREGLTLAQLESPKTRSQQ